MQNWKGCSELSQGDSVELTDKRDGNKYTVRKMKDGRCWMAQNLRIIDKTVSSDDTDIESGTFTIPASNAGSFTSGNINSPATYQTGSLDNGVLYNFYAASGGTGGSSHTSGDAKGSICPKGWKLPTGHGCNPSYSDDYGDLLKAYAGKCSNVTDSSFVSDFNPTKHGCVNVGGSVVASCDAHFWWSSTVSSVSGTQHYMYDLEDDSSSTSSWSMYSCSDRYKDSGNAVRCVLR